MEAELKIDTGGFERFIDSLESHVDPGRPGGVQDGLVASSDVYHAAMRERFDIYSERGGDWAEHAPGTIRRRGEGAPILNETGVLRESMDRDARGHVLETTASSVIEGTEDRTARFHQSGTSKMPARPILFEPEGQTVEAMKVPIVGGVRAAILEAVK